MSEHDPPDGPMPDDPLPDDPLTGGRSTEDLGDDDHVDPELGEQLRALLGPTDGLDRRTTRDVDSALRARSPLSAALELFGVGWWTLETLFSDGSSADDRTRGADARSLMDPWLDADGDLEGT